MFRKFTLAFVTLTFCSLFTLEAANERTHNWYFGQNAGLTFSSGAPAVLTNGAMNTGEGCSSISDKSGNLEFYTSGINVYTRNHTVMVNGTGLGGDNSSTQSALIVPKPGSTSIYYIFTADAWGRPRGIRYSEVDMTLQGGLGEVTVKNVQLITPAHEKLTAVCHANGSDYWVIAHERNHNRFSAYLVSNTGVNTTPVTSTSAPTAMSNMHDMPGALKASPDGTKLVQAIYTRGLFELYDFDNSTGMASNRIQLAPAPAHRNAYGVEFSPNSQVVYCAYQTDWIYQYDLNAGSASAIVNSATAIGNSVDMHTSLQLGSDGKIYVARPGSVYLAVINQPNTLGLGCSFVDNGINLGSGKSRAGLPNFASCFLAPCDIPWPRHPLGPLSGGSDYDFEYGYAVTADPDGNIYNTGHITGTTDFEDGISVTPKGGQDLFLSKYNDCETEWAISGGGADDVLVYATSVDHDGVDDMIYLSGVTDGPMTFGGIFLNVTTTKGVVAKVDPNGNVIWARAIDGASAHPNKVYDVKYDENTQEVYVVGAFNKEIEFADFSETSFGYGEWIAGRQLSWPQHDNDWDMFIAKFDQNGNELWLDTYGGYLDDEAYALDIDINTSDVYITGYTMDPNPNSFGSGSPLNWGQEDIFIGKYDASGSRQWSDFVGGNSRDVGNDIVVEGNSGNGQVFVAGSFEDLLSGSGVASAGQSDVLVLSYDQNGSQLWFDHGGWQAVDEAMAIDLTPGGEVIVTGNFDHELSFPNNPILDIATLTGENIFLAAYDPGGSGLWSIPATPMGGWTRVKDVVVSGEYSFITGGVWDGSVQFGTAPVISTTPGTDIYVARLNNDAIVFQKPTSRDRFTPAETATVLRMETEAGVSPNPTTGKIVITPPVADESRLREVRISDIFGNEVQCPVRFNRLDNTIDIDLNGNAPGLYFYSLRYDNCLLSGKSMLIE